MVSLLKYGEQRRARRWWLLAVSLFMVTLPFFADANQASNCTKGSVLRHDRDTVACNGGSIGSENDCKRAAELDRNYNNNLRFDEGTTLRDAHKPYGCLYDTGKNVYVFNHLSTGLGTCSSEFECVCRSTMCAECTWGTNTPRGALLRQ